MVFLTSTYLSTKEMGGDNHYLCQTLFNFLHKQHTVVFLYSLYKRNVHNISTYFIHNEGSSIQTYQGPVVLPEPEAQGMRSHVQLKITSTFSCGSMFNVKHLNFAADKFRVLLLWNHFAGVLNSLFTDRDQYWSQYQVITSFF